MIAPRLVRFLLPFAALAAVASPLGAQQAPLVPGMATPGPLVPQLAAAQPVVPFATTAKSAIMMDAATGTVLYAKNPDLRIPPASMGKMMTVYLAFEMLKAGQIKLTDSVTVAPETWRAWHSQGSTMFLAANQQVTIEELLHGIVTLSGNDACVVLAEGIAGSEAAYVAAMNQSAAKIGLKSSVFANTTGWPDPNEYVTARDLATLARRTIVDFPELYKQFYGIDKYTFGTTMGGQPITQGNRNPLLGKVSGADGLKTGHTEEAGYGLTGSAVQGQTRLITVVTGLTSMAERASEAVRFMQWGMRTFETRTLFRAGASIVDAPVAFGKDAAVPLVAPAGVAVTLSRMDLRNVSAKASFTGPLKAPVAKGAAVGQLVIKAPGKPAQVVPLVAGRAVAAVGPIGRLGANIGRLFGAGAPAAP